ncbi:VIN3-like protein 2 [Striga hermonthica]|uniref:VIN3-like protein 2 n=1 Tax=Striga hermonthica TaxID=68872 RepID=A0A9N7RKB1_STRHE|nr:VIN3-like protein 2 [Striga hermonthica]
MDASGLEALFDPSTFNKLSMDQKRQLVHEMSKWPDGATEILHSWTRLELLQILCAELGKERKYTGLSKSKIIEQLLRTIHEKNSKECGPTNIPETQKLLLENGERTSKRQKKSEPPNLVPADTSGAMSVDLEVEYSSIVYCKNSACKAKLSSGSVFCKRCSCCICRQYDDNKDPSLWLMCNTDPPFHGVACGMSCHLECALRHENSGISQDKGLDGSFCCVSCGKINDLLSSWKKQLVVARDTRRVDILGYRLSLGQKILAGTKHYQNLYDIIDEAVKKLEDEVGPLTGLPVKKARGIVNRLSTGPEIQRLCASAVESLDLILSNRVSEMPSGYNTLASKLVQFEDIGATSLAVNLHSDESNTKNLVGYSLWHRKADDAGYSADPTCRLFEPNTKFHLSGLTPDTLYLLKVAILNNDREMGLYEFQFQTACAQDDALNTNSEPERSQSQSQIQSPSQSPATNCSTLSNPSSVEDETNNIIAADENGDDDRSCSPFTTNGKIATQPNLPNEIAKSSLLANSNKESSGDCTAQNTMSVDDNGPDRAPVSTGLECVPYVASSEANLPITPCKFESLKDENRPKFKDGSERDMEPQAGSSSKKRDGRKRDGCHNNGIGDKDFEYYVKAVRWLECEGYIEMGFRKKFLTWYSLRANPQEVRVVKVFVDTFIEDPESLAGQLVDTFSDVISNNGCSRVPGGFCMKLWH